LLDALQAFHDPCRGCVARSEPREPVFHSLVGQVRARARQAIAPLALHGVGGTSRGMPRGLSADGGEAAPRRQTSQGRVAEERGAPAGVLLVDASGLVKTGQDAVGVARQSWGPLGKGAQRHVGGGAASAARQGSALGAKRRCRPEQWFPEASAASRDTGRVPPAVTWPPTPP
jgi:hypothetical protein